MASRWVRESHWVILPRATCAVSTRTTWRLPGYLEGCTKCTAFGTLQPGRISPSMPIARILEQPTTSRGASYPHRLGDRSGDASTALRIQARFDWNSFRRPRSPSPVCSRASKSVCGCRRRRPSALTAVRLLASVVERLADVGFRVREGVGHLAGGFVAQSREPCSSPAPACDTSAAEVFCGGATPLVFLDCLAWISASVLLRSWTVALISRPLIKMAFSPSVAARIVFTPRSIPDGWASRAARFFNLAGRRSQRCRS